MKTWSWMSGCIVIAVALAACGGQDAPPQTEPEVVASAVAPAGDEGGEPAVVQTLTLEESVAATPDTEAPVVAPRDAEESVAATPDTIVSEPVAEVVATDAPAASAAAPVEASASNTAVFEDGIPRAVVDEPVFNYGVRRDDETVTHQFVLRNEGTGLLKINNVRASCGCTTTDLPTDELAPGEEVKIEASTNLRNRQGPQRMSITVTTNDPEQPAIQLTLEGEALAAIMIEPRTVNWGRIDDDEPREATVVLRSTKEDLTFAVQSVELTGMAFIEHELKEVEPGRKYELHVRTTGDVPAGNHSTRMIIRTDAEERALLWLPISMQAVGPLQITPPAVHIRYAEDLGEFGEQLLRIAPGRVDAFTIEEVLVPMDSIEATLNPGGPNQYTLFLENLPLSDALEGKSVVLRTNIPDHEEIEIPFHIFKQRSRVIQR